MSQYLDKKQVIELYAQYQPCMATHVYEFGEKLMALPTTTIPVAELDNTEDFAEWIDRSDGGRIRYPFWKRYECSKCGAKSENTNFCPNCGSDNRPRILDEAVDGAGKDGNVKEGDEK
jgi:rubrerythrin